MELRMRTLFTAALLASAVAAPAYAQDAGTFTGFRVEGLVGYDRFDIGGEDDTDDGLDESIDGVTYGVAAGYDFDLGNAVLGIEGEFSDSSGELDDDEDIFSVRPGRDLYIGARAGFKAGPRTLVYAKAGYTNTSIEADEEDGAGNTFELDTEIDGYRLGAGVEHKFGEKLYGKLEYRYSNYSSIDLGGEEVGIDLDRHQVVAGVGIRF
jgi:outer membrane immunogenic protein